MSAQPDQERTIALPKRWLSACLFSIVLLLVISTWVSTSSMSHLAAARELEERSLETRWSLARVELLLTDAETGQRGFIITGDESYLTIAESAFARIPSELEHLQKLLPLANEAKNDFRELNELAAAKLNLMKRGIEVRRSSGFDQAAQRVAKGNGKAVMDTLRARVLALDLKQVDLLQQHRRDTQIAARKAELLVLSANLLACMTALFSADQARRAFKRSQQAKIAVNQANEQLENNVARRTEQLHEALEQLKLENQQRQQLESELLNVTDREQRRVAEDLHDGQAQLLAGALHLLNSLAQRLTRSNLAEAKEAENLKDLVREALEQTRSIARGLYPVKDTPRGLELALSELSSRTRQLLNVDCEFQHEARVLLADNLVATNLFRIANEAVNNAVRHGRASRVAIRLGTDNSGVTMEVRDNGAGLPDNFANAHGLGVRMMQYRAQMLGATLQIEPLPGGGTRAFCRAPALLTADSINS